ncbi:MAG: hypothetical protein ACRD3C_19000 [Vicinamibacterales bacterium]
MLRAWRYDLQPTPPFGGCANFTILRRLGDHELRAIHGSKKDATDVLAEHSDSEQLYATYERHHARGRCPAGDDAVRVKAT